MKKLVILFPEVEFLTCDDPKIIDKYNKCIQKRYIEKGFHPFVVNYKNSKGFYTFLNKTQIDSEIGFYSKEALYPNFTHIVDKLGINKNDKIVVCGFHCFDCVYKLANEIYKVNKNVIIDSNLTDLFPTVIKQKNFDIEKFNPNDEIITTLYAWEYNKKVPNLVKDKLYLKYSNPVWGISKKCLKKLNSKNNEI